MKKDIEEYIEEYKKMAFICSQIDYSEPKTIRLNNKAVKRMYEIINLIDKEYKEDIHKFLQLLDTETDRTNIWLSIQILEKLKIDQITEEKALKIIKKDAEDSIGMRYWLENYFQQNKHT